MGVYTPHDPYFVPQVEIAIITARDQSLIDEADSEEAHIDVL